MRQKVRVAVAVLTLILAACGNPQFSGLVMPPDHRAEEFAPADSTTMRGPGMMGGGG